MKKQLILATMLALFVISCSKKNNPPAPSTKGYFRAKVDGVFFSDSTSANVTIPLFPGPGGYPLWTVISGSSNGTRIALILPPFLSTGERLLPQSLDAITINISSTSFYAGSNNNISTGSSGSKVQGSGKINILEITSSYVRGSFECIAPVDSTIGVILPSLNITEGEFNLNF